MSRESKDSRRKLIESANTLNEILAARATIHGDDTAYKYIVGDNSDPISITYKDLYRKSMNIAKNLAMFCKKGDRALMLYSSNIEFISAFFGCLYAGVIAVPAYPPRRNQKINRLKSIVTDSDPKVILTTQNITDFAQEMFEEDGMLQDIEWVSSDQIKIFSNDSNIDLPSVEGDDIAFLQYTSGSTGNPKGVVVKHNNIINNEEVLYNVLENDDKTVCASWLPLFHDMGLIYGALHPIYGGLEAILMDPTFFLQKPIRLLRIISKYKVNSTGGPNFMYDLCTDNIKDEDLKDLDLSSWRIAYNGAEPILPATLDRFYKRFSRFGLKRSDFFPCYGMAETTLFIAGSDVKKAPSIIMADVDAIKNNRIIINKTSENSRELISCGKPWFGHNIKIVDPKTLKLCKNDEVGEIWTSGDSITDGYWQKPEINAEIFNAYISDSKEGPFLRTGDLGFCHKGEIYITGRLKDVVIIRGRNHYPQDIELTSSHSHIALTNNSTAAFTIDNKDNSEIEEEKLIIVQEVKRNFIRKVDFNEIFDAIKSAIASEHDLQIYDIILLKPGRILKTSSGKIQRSANKRAYLEDALDILSRSKRDSYNIKKGKRFDDKTISNITLDKKTKTTQTRSYFLNYLTFYLAKLADIDVKSIDVRKSLLEIGCDSLATAQISAHISEVFDFNVDIEELFEYNSINHLIDDLYKNTANNQNHEHYQHIAVQDRSHGVPLSSAQERLWFLDQYESRGDIYNVPILLDIKGNLDLEIAEKVLTNIVERHEALRTNFVKIHKEDNAPIQIINANFNLDIEERYIDISNKSNIEIESTIKQNSLKTFDLKKDLLLDATIYRTGQKDKNYILLNIHHIICDGWSIKVLTEEFATLYKAYKDKLDAPLLKLPVLPIQYGDYVLWKKQNHFKALREKHLNYWQKHLSGFTTLELPTSFKRPLNRSYEGGSLEFKISKSITNRLKKIAKKYDCTLFMAILTSFNILLHKYSGQEDIVIGTASAGRRRVEVERLIGFFVNSLPIRQDLSGDPTFINLLKKSKRITLDAFKNQDVSLVKILETLKVKRDNSRSPLFQTMLVLNEQLIDFSGGDIEIKPKELSNGSSKFDLTLSLTPNKENDLIANLEYATDLFSVEYINRFVSHFKQLLNSIIKNPKQNISNLDILTKREEKQLLKTYNNTDKSYPNNLCIHHLFEHQAKKNPNNVAVTFEDRSLTYGELNKKSEELAIYLQELGVKPDGMVGIYVDRSLEMVIGILAILKAGGAYLPLDPSYPSDRLSYMVEDSGVKIILTQDAVEKQLSKISGDKGDLEIVNLDQSYKAKTDILRREVQSDNLAYVIYTSGSTGLPKGVMVEHKTINNLIKWELNHKNINDVQENVLGLTTIAFDVFIQELSFCIATASNFIIVPDEIKKDFAAISKFIIENNIKVAFLPYVALRSLLLELKNHDKIPVKSLITAGEQLIITDDIRDFFSKHINVTLYNEYGPTESHVCTALKMMSNPDQWLNYPSIGKPVSNTQIYILDENLNPVPKGVVGELHIAGDGLARGYLNRDDLTKEKFINNPFSKDPKSRMYKSGDLAKWLDDGNIECLGRVDTQVKIRGFRIEIGEVESTLNKYEDILESVIIAKDVNDSGSKQLISFYVSKDDKEIEANKLKEYLKSSLPDYMVPSAFVKLDLIPLTPNGKVDRRLLEQKDVKVTTSTKYEPPRNEMEEKLVRIWQDVLGVDKVGINDNFFDLGGHSLLATQLVSRVKEEFEVEFSIRELFQSPYILGVSSWIDDHGDDGSFIDFKIINKLEDGDKFRLFLNQERLWFLDQFEERATYNIPLAIRVEGYIRMDVLRKSVYDLLDRHKILRSNIVVEDDVPFQTISVNSRVDYEEVELDGSNESEKLDCSRELLRQDSNCKFDLENDSLVRFRVHRISDVDNIFYVNIHHIISDLWSAKVLLRDLSEIYNAYLDGRKVRLPELEFQYWDYAFWQKGESNEKFLKDQLSYWVDKLDGYSNVLNLETDYKRPVVKSGLGSVIQYEMSEGLFCEVKDFCKDRNLTVFNLCLSGLYVLLSRYSNQSDICIGIPVTERGEHKELENLVGFFVNTMTLRLNPDDGFNMSCDDLLGYVKESIVEGYENKNLHFEELVKVIQPHKDMARSPVFQVCLSYQGLAESFNLDLGGTGASFFGVDYEVSKFDLEFFVSESDQGMTLRVCYNTDIFKEETVKRMCSHYEEVLNSLMVFGDSSIGEVDVMSSDDLEEVLVDFNNTDKSYPNNLCIHHLFEHQAKKNPNNVAVTFEDRSLTYGELDEKSEELAIYLQELGVKPDSMVGIYVERSLEMVIGILAILKAGGAYLPLDPSYPSDRLSYMVEDSGVKIILTQDAVEKQLSKISGDKGDLEIVNLDQSYKAKTDILRREVQSDNLAYVIYTSGSTGLPKGVMIEHKNVVNFLIDLKGKIGITKGDNFLALTTYCFDISVAEMFLPLVSSAVCYIGSEYDARDFELLSKKIQEVNPTFIQATPATWNGLFSAGWKPSNKLKILCGGESLKMDLFDKLFSYESWNLFGPTETTIWSSCYKINDGLVNDAVSIGKPVSNTQIYILDENLNPVPKGVVGELHIAGDGLARGYLNRDDLTKEKFINNPFSKDPKSRMYKSGDLAKWLDDGNIECLGRVDTQVKIRGFRIEIGEVESTLNKYEDILESVIIAKDVNDSGSKQLISFYVSKDDKEIEANKLKEYLKSSLPDYMVPSAFVKLDLIPLTPNGKVDRRLLEQKDVKVTTSTKYEPPRNEMEEKLVRIWQDVLGVDKVGINDNFFDLGGHSLLATQLVSRVKEEFEVEFSIRELFQSPYILGVSSWIDDHGDDGSFIDFKIINKLEDGDKFRLFLNQERLWFLDQFEERATYNIPLAIRVEGYIRMDVLRKSVYDLLDRHKILRSNIVVEDDVPFQTISVNSRVDYEEVELDGSNESEKLDCSRELLRQDSNCKFDLENDSLVRFRVHRISDVDNIFYVNIHHIISDLWSAKVLLRDLSEIYNAYLDGRKVRLPELEFQYWDYAFWQKGESNEKFLKDQLSYWVDKLDGYSNVLNLETDYKRPVVKSGLGSVIQYEMSEGLFCEVKDFCKDRNLTVFNLCLSGLYVLLSRYSNQSDICIGIPVTERGEHKELENLVGFFVNTMTLRLNPDDGFNMSCDDLLGYVKESIVEGYENKNLHFEELVKVIQPHKDMARSPVFQVCLSYQGLAESFNLDLGGTGASFFGVDYEVSKFDLEFFVSESDQGMTLRVCYNTDIFKEETVKRMCSHYEEVLNSLMVFGDSSIGEVDVMSSDDLEEVLVDFNNTDKSYPNNLCIHHLFEHQAKKNPNNVAVTFEDRSLTYGELDEKSEELAIYLQELGVKPDSMVGIYVERSLEMVIGILAILKAGGAYLPLDPSYPSDRLSYMVEDSGVKIILTQDAVEKQLSKISGDKGDLEIVNLDQSYKAKTDILRREVQSDNLAYVIYTSGSTGLPKGVQTRHFSLVNVSLYQSSLFAINSKDRVMQFSSMNFDAATWEIFLTLVRGSNLILVPSVVKRDLDALRSFIQRNSITFSIMVPSLIKMLNLSEIHSLKTIVSGGEVFDPTILNLLDNGVSLFNAYGPTENTICSTIYKVENKQINGSIPIGKPVSNTQIYILDENLNPVPKGVVGELHIAGDGLARGYLNRDDLTKEKFINNPFSKDPKSRMYKSGDLAKWLDDGNIECLGRVDTQVKIRGFRIEIGEVESTLNKYEDILESVIIAKDVNDSGSKQLISFYVSKDDKEIEANKLKEYLKSSLPDYMVPSAFVKLDLIPLTPNGKVDRRLLEQKDVKVTTSTKYEPPRNEMEEKLVRIWQDVLGVDKVGINDNFFDLGGHSLSSTQLVSKINSEINFTVNVGDIFKNPTINELSNFIIKGLLNFSASTNSVDKTKSVEETKKVKLLINDLFQNVESLSRSGVDSASLISIDEDICDNVGVSTDEFIRYMDNKPKAINLHNTMYGKIVLIMLPIATKDLYLKKEELIAKSVAALKIAKSMGANIVSLTGNIPSATNYGIDINDAIIDRDDVCQITTGHTVTASAILLNTEEILDLSMRSIKNETFGFLGLGSVGKTILRLMLAVGYKPKEIILCDVYQKGQELELLREEIHSKFGYLGNVKILRSKSVTPLEFYNSTFIIGASNVPDILDVSLLRPGTILVDDSAPFCFDESKLIKRLNEKKDILFKEAGSIFLPEAKTSFTGNFLRENKQVDLSFIDNKSRKITGCVFSSLITRKVEQLKPTIGDVDINICKKYYVVLKSMGITGSDLSTWKYTIDDKVIDNFAKNYGGEAISEFSNKIL